MSARSVRVTSDRKLAQNLQFKLDKERACHALTRARQRRGAQLKAEREVARLRAAIAAHRDGVLNHDRWDDDKLWSALG